MTARAIWKGRIHFGGIDVPVKLYSAIEERSVPFRLLERKRKVPVRQQMVERGTGNVVEMSDVQRAFERSGELVVISPEELEALEPESSREIEVEAFLPRDSIDALWYDRPYFVGPDEDLEGYFAIRAALKRRKREGLARWVMRKRQYLGVLRVEEDHLVLVTLRSVGEVVQPSALEAPAGRDLEARELKMARQLIEAMEGVLDLAAFRDEYRERVLDLVEAKAAGKIVRFPRPTQKPKERSLAEDLERSLTQTRRRASA